ncbi:MAG: glycosyl hydrolase 53 family protein [Paludibacteraceae bacterium]|nr:glycosyl hydrolase 53 family protein [Paludibacteraceae bacterium]
MKKQLFSIFLCAMALVSGSVHAANSGLYFYYWNSAASTGGDLAEFQTTSETNVFIIDSCELPAYDIAYTIHNSDWSIKYGWGANTENVDSIGKNVELELGAEGGWSKLTAGKYQITFDTVSKVIRFEEPVQTLSKQTGSFLRGGDLSMVTYLEDWGAKFKYKDGTEGDVFAILEEYGINLARLRLYHTPGTAVAHNSDTYRTPVKTRYNSWAGRPNYYAGLTDILNLAKRAKDHNMQICLSIYLSDFWSGATEQYIPAAWSGVTSHSVLLDSVTNYVTRVMQLMVAQGTTPEYVSIGNESNYGILFNKSSNPASYGGHTSTMSQCVALFNAAYDAVKAVSSTSQVIIHHSYGDNGTNSIYVSRNFFQNLKNNGCKYDIVGGSYYPHWAGDHGSTDNTPSACMNTWATAMKNAVNKPVMLMEVGYSWDKYRPVDKNGGKWMGQLQVNGTYNEASQTGQEKFMRELHAAMKTDANILGYMYWDPIFVDQKVDGYWIESCWAEKYSGSGDEWWTDGNVISNTTLFDYSGKALRALYNEIASYAEEGPATATEDVQRNDVRCTKVLKEGQLYLMYKGTMYDVQGRKIR